MCFVKCFILALNDNNSLAYYTFPTLDSGSGRIAVRLPTSCGEILFQYSSKQSTKRRQFFRLSAISVFPINDSARVQLFTIISIRLLHAYDLHHERP